MCELEMQVGRLLGASSFYIYQTLKHNYHMSVRDLEIETGISFNTVQIILTNLLRCGIVRREKKGKRCYTYCLNNEKETWKLH